MRARTRRLHHSSSVPPRKRPRSTCPSTSNRTSAASIVAVSTAKRSASSATVTGPLDSSQPRRISANASSRRSGSGVAGATAAIAGIAVASAYARCARSSRSAQVQNAAPSASVSVVARRCATSMSYHGCQVSSGGTTTSVASASCSSSASRTSGHDDSATSAIAAGSRIPLPSRSARVVRRSVTARVRRSSSGASSR